MARNKKKHGRKKEARARKTAWRKLTDQERAIRSYSARNNLLLSLGYSSYPEYLASPLWADIKRRAAEVHGTRCLVCDKPARVVHHLRYDQRTLLGESLTQLAPLCVMCHRRVEFKLGGVKRTLSEARGAYHLLLLRRETPPDKSLGSPAPPLLAGSCSVCGRKAKKGGTLCRPCARSADEFSPRKAAHRGVPRPCPDARASPLAVYLQAYRDRHPPP